MISFKIKLFHIESNSENFRCTVSAIKIPTISHELYVKMMIWSALNRILRYATVAVGAINLICTFDAVLYYYRYHTKLLTIRS